MLSERPVIVYCDIAIISYRVISASDHIVSLSEHFYHCKVVRSVGSQIWCCSAFPSSTGSALWGVITLLVELALGPGLTERVVRNNGPSADWALVRLCFISRIITPVLDLSISWHFMSFVVRRHGFYFLCETRGCWELVWKFSFMYPNHAHFKQ